MIKIQGALPRRLIVAMSGGMDSVAAGHFLLKRHDISLLYVNHHDQVVEDEVKAVCEIAMTWNVPLIVKSIEHKNIPKGVSRESWWHQERFKVFHSFDDTIVTGHHLDDCVESWVWSCMHGNGYIIPYRNRNVIRPFRLNTKDQLEKSLHRCKARWIEDPTNMDTDFAMRNYVRHVMMPHVMKVNPGIRRVVRKKVIEDCDENYRMDVSYD